MELLNEWYPITKFRKVDTTFRTESTNEKELTDALPLTLNALHKTEMEYHRKLGHTIGRIQHISLMTRLDLLNATCRLKTQTMAPTIPYFQGIKRCVQFLASHPHETIFYTSNYYDG